MDKDTLNKTSNIDTLSYNLRELKFFFFAKRLIDIIAVVLGLLIFSWLFLIIPILIKLENPKGPVFFKQKRVGKDGNPFYLYKFRSMVPGAEGKLDQLLKYNEVSGAMFKIKEDPRLTKVGKFIRRRSIDELPQILNVLKGEMSIVGPRPALPREVKEYSDHDKQRLLVTPGCTGLWQVSGRSTLSFEEMVNLDLSYIKNMSICLDIKIILKTFLLLFGSKSAF
ncbi:sugar transferase [Peribacillus kribbensis]|uniref:sugar transferase n=1 Tax=Peribacillus kribbensis TaxID=356658 RepID=UPI00041F1875|nr:sugar transferase [Peribacillus kribbensis]